MYAGKIVEQAEARELFANPLHPYTIGLFNSLDQWVARLHGFVLHVKRLLVKGSSEISFEQRSSGLETAEISFSRTCVYISVF